MIKEINKPKAIVRMSTTIKAISPDPTLFNKTLTFQETSKSSRETVIYIHGGAWNDPSNTPNDFNSLANVIKSMDVESNICQFSMEYRLSPEITNPRNLYDVVANITRLVKEKGLTSLNIVGHSVGATFIWQILSVLKHAQENMNEAQLQMLELLRTVKRVFLLDGIYSLKELLEEYPQYDCFTKLAFPDGIQMYEEEPSIVMSHVKKALFRFHVDMHVVHSYHDELLSLRQTNSLIACLQNYQINFRLYLDDLGLHNDVYKNDKVAKYIFDNTH
ncbi:Bna7p [Saccharomyces cerevisiae x Saccharomyces kudriavzevii VIN7]|uniref:Kynurenine formamidase n=1 Tax=Saccharomyces cerevisiae x Saccharomyces kudriavzevii (strain VIN7) TaxID=1095631 RepID=H0GTD1_SACCK|nr:Bna7p [Saccharomyces cerevisiae x Saccharomyces kudriavzevii VIN7]